MVFGWFYRRMNMLLMLFIKARDIEVEIYRVSEFQKYKRFESVPSTHPSPSPSFYIKKIKAGYCHCSHIWDRKGKSVKVSQLAQGQGPHTPSACRRENKEEPWS